MKHKQKRRKKQTYRRFYVAFRSWPWRLALLCNDSIPWEMKEEIANAFFAASWCCLDEFFSRRLRSVVSTPAELLAPAMLRFLRACFENATSATTKLENGFAHVRHWLQSYWRAPHLSTLCHHYVAENTHRIHA